MLLYILLLSVLSYQHVESQFGDYAQDFGYVEVREGAHMFYWLFYTTADVANYNDRPLIVWLQGGPGGGSTGTGNFQLIGPLDMALQERNHTWIKNFNVIFLDNPVGAGFSYVTNTTLFPTTNDEIALDFVEFMRDFYSKHPEFSDTPLYIYGQSYGGKMAVDMALRMHEAQENGSIRSNIRGIGLGNAWIHPVNATRTWAPLLLAAGLIDEAGYENIQREALLTEEYFYSGRYIESTMQWGATQNAVFREVTNLDFYNILSKTPSALPDTRMNVDSLELAKDMLINNRPYGMNASERNEPYTMYYLMNFIVKPTLNVVPQDYIWGWQAGYVFNALLEDFMKPVTHEIERLLNETDIIVQPYNGNLDLICDTPGQILWVDRLNWHGAEAYKNSPRYPIWENDRLEGYYKAQGNFRFFWINHAGHSVPNDNPEGTNAFLRDMTSFG